MLPSVRQSRLNSAIQALTKRELVCRAILLTASTLTLLTFGLTCAFWLGAMYKRGTPITLAEGKAFGGFFLVGGFFVILIAFDFANKALSKGYAASETGIKWIALTSVIELAATVGLITALAK